MKISDSILSILSRMRFDGSVAFLPDGQLDRKVYTEVNKVLESLGGKWNRAKKGHVFDGNAEDRLDLAITTGEYVDHAKELGFFETPESLALAVVMRAGVRPGEKILEPSAGLGRIAGAIIERGAIAVVAEIDSGRMKALTQRFAVNPAFKALTGYAIDFMLIEPTAQEHSIDRVVMNPPFCKVGGKDHIDHVKHAARFVRRQDQGFSLTAILPSSVMFREDRRHIEFREWISDHNGSLHKLPDGAFLASGTGVNTCLLTIP